jgi:hypothetical protein
LLEIGTCISFLAPPLISVSREVNICGLDICLQATFIFIDTFVLLAELPETIFKNLWAHNFLHKMKKAVLN